MFHIPYFFFAAKEFLLVLYDETASRSLSQKLESKLSEPLRKEERRQEASTRLKA